MPRPVPKHTQILQIVEKRPQGIRNGSSTEGSLLPADFLFMELVCCLVSELDEVHHALCILSLVVHFPLHLRSQSQNA
jgi:hypothetical protein